MKFVKFSFNIHCAALKETFHPIYATLKIFKKQNEKRKENKFITFTKEEFDSNNEKKKNIRKKPFQQ